MRREKREVTGQTQARTMEATVQNVNLVVRFASLCGKLNPGRTSNCGFRAAAILAR